MSETLQIKNLINYSWWVKNRVVIACVSVIAVFYIAISCVIVNIPYNDDHNAFFRFLYYFEERGWRTVFQQHNEHRIVWFKLLVLLDYHLSKSVNIMPYIMIGNLSLLGITVILYRSFKMTEDKLLYFLPVILLLFVPVSHMHNWGMATFVNITVILFVYISLFFLNKDSNKSLVIAIIFSVLAAFSVGSGIFVFPAGIVLLTVFGVRKKRLLVWCATTLVVWKIYFTGYRTPLQHGSVIDNMIDHWDQMLLYPFGFAGSALKSVLPTKGSIIIAGGILVILMLFLAIKKWSYFKDNPLIITYLTFLALIIGAAAINKGYQGSQAAFADRYRILHVLILGLIYLSTLQAFPNISKLVLRGLIGLSILFYVVRIADNIPKLLANKEKLEFSLMAYWAEQMYDIDSWYSKSSETTVETLDLAIKRGTYVPPKYMLPKVILTDTDRLKTTSQHEIKLDVYKDTKKGLTIHGNAFIKNYEQHISKQKIYVILKSQKLTYLIPAQKFQYYKPPSVRNRKKRAKPLSAFPDNSAFSFILPKEKVDLQNGTYHLGIFIEQGKHIKTVRYFNKKIEL